MQYSKLIPGNVTACMACVSQTALILAYILRLAAVLDELLCNLMMKYRTSFIQLLFLSECMEYDLKDALTCHIF
jgi:hypothetical protein